MAKKKQIACPYCGEKAGTWKRPDGKNELEILHKMKCKLANAVNEPQAFVSDCPPEMLGINHGSFFSL